MPDVILCQCPHCGWRWTAQRPANLTLFTTCPNPTLLPADVPAKAKRLCRGNLRHHVITLTPSEAWGAP